MKRFISILTLIGFFYSLGVITGRYRLFPYKQLNQYYSIYKQKQGNVYDDTLNRVVSKPNPSDSLKVFITLGQSNTSNSGEFFQTNYNGVFNFYNGNTYEYKDPSLGTSGSGMSVWGLVGNELIKSGYTEKVVFLNLGVGGVSLNQIMSGDIYNSFVKGYNDLITQYGKVDGILFHQGERNNLNVSGNSNYFNEFVEFYNNNVKNKISSPIYLCQTSFCNNTIDRQLLEIQDSLIVSLPNVLRGPNTDLITYYEFRDNTNCHFSRKGLEWFSSEFSKKIQEGQEY